MIGKAKNARDSQNSVRSAGGGVIISPSQISRQNVFRSLVNRPVQSNVIQTGVREYFRKKTP